MLKKSKLQSEKREELGRGDVGNNSNTKNNIIQGLGGKSKADKFFKGAQIVKKLRKKGFEPIL